jgi:putative transcriptional regulator
MDEKMFDELLESVKWAGKYMRGEAQPSRMFHFPDLDVQAIRETTGLSQGKFAALVGVSRRTLENWEQGRRKPTGPARALLRIVAADPAGAIRALHVQPQGPEKQDGEEVRAPFATEGTGGCAKLI